MWYDFIDSGGQPQFLEMLPAFIPNVSLLLLISHPSTAQKGGAEIEPSDQEVTIPGLLAHLSCCSPPTVTTVASARALTSTITALTVSGSHDIEAPGDKVSWSLLEGTWGRTLFGRV